ncbi:MAG: hypothetical protein Q7U02_00810 [Desulfosalsimonadaceae bacterium]|nr:hypothetical protein [Desulfosalsimonadaceae bacterium]
MKDKTLFVFLAVKKIKIDTLTGNRFQIALELFLEGKSSFTYKGIVFHKDSEWLYVNSYSDYLIENTTREMGIEKIAYSKEVLNEVLESVPKFKNAVSNLKWEYAFCYDYHTGAVAIAIQKDDEIEWLLEKLKNC